MPACADGVEAKSLGNIFDALEYVEYFIGTFRPSLCRICVHAGSGSVSKVADWDGKPLARAR